MRAVVALTIYVSFGYAVARGADNSWQQLHDQGLAASRQRDFTKAAEMFQMSWVFARNRVERGVSANDLGVTLHQMARDGKAVPWLVRALAIWRSDAAQHIHVLQTSEVLASVLRALGEYSMAELLLHETLARSADGEEKAAVLNLLADLMREEGKSEAARATFGDVLRIPGISWRRMYESYAGLADLDCTARLWEDSTAEWNSAANIAREHHDAGLEAVASRGLAETWLEQGNTSRAEPLLRRALAVFENDPLSGNQIAATLRSLGQLYLGENKPALAEDALTRALAREEALLGHEHPQIAILLELLGDTAALRNQMELARDYFGRALHLLEQKFGENSVVSGAVFANWGVAEQRSGDNVRAAAQYEKSLVILRGGGDDAAQLRMIVTERYAAVLKSTHHRKEAKALLAEVKSVREK